jgi:hypothetical protein
VAGDQPGTPPRCLQDRHVPRGEVPAHHPPAPAVSRPRRAGLLAVTGLLTWFDVQTPLRRPSVARARSDRPVTSGILPGHRPPPASKPDLAGNPLSHDLSTADQQRLPLQCCGVTVVDLRGQAAAGVRSSFYLGYMTMVRPMRPVAHRAKHLDQPQPQRGIMTWPTRRTPSPPPKTRGKPSVTEPFSF